MIILTEFSEPSPSWIWRGGSAASRRRKSVSLGGPLRQRATTDLLRFPSLWHLCLLDGGERRWETVVNLLKAFKPECLPLHLRPFVQESFGGWGRVARFSTSLLLVRVCREKRSFCGWFEVEQERPQRLHR